MLCGKAFRASRKSMQKIQCEITTRSVGCAIVVKMKCNAGHVFTWSSSPVIRNANRQTIYKCNLAFASSLLFSGNNYYKIRQFFKFIDVSCIAPSTYFTYQRLCLCLVISDFYDRQMVISILYFIFIILFY